ncbi:hypothetical protein QF028_000820 [Neobacillus sp. B4I6]
MRNKNCIGALNFYWFRVILRSKVLGLLKLGLNGKSNVGSLKKYFFSVGDKLLRMFKDLIIFNSFHSQRDFNAMP